VRREISFNQRARSLKKNEHCIRALTSPGLSVSTRSKRRNLISPPRIDSYNPVRMKRLLLILLLLLSPNLSFTTQTAAFPSGSLTLKLWFTSLKVRVRFRPCFRKRQLGCNRIAWAILCLARLGLLRAIQTWPRSQGLGWPVYPGSKSEPPRGKGLPAASRTMVRLLQTDHLDDQLAALTWLRKQPFVRPNRVAVAGNSFGGIESVLGSERESYCAAAT